MSRYEQAKELEKEIEELKSYILELSRISRSCSFWIKLTYTRPHISGTSSFKLKMKANGIREEFKSLVNKERNFIEEKIKECTEKFNQLTKDE
jgi:hypothetical protein